MIKITGAGIWRSMEGEARRRVTGFSVQFGLLHLKQLPSQQLQQSKKGV
jgi:hypothetical protein